MKGLRVQGTKGRCVGTKERRDQGQMKGLRDHGQMKGLTV